MIAVPAAPLAPDEAARRAAARPGAFWLSAPAADEVGIARDLVGAAPVGSCAPRCAGGSRRASSRPGRRRARPGRRRARAPPAGRPGGGRLALVRSRARVRRPAGARRRAASRPGRWSSFTFTTPSGCATRAARATIFAQDAAAARRLADLLSRPAPGGAGAAPAGRADGRSPGRGLSCDGVARILEYLRAGDAYQVNLSRRLSATCAPAAVGAGRAGGGAARARARARTRRLSRRRTATARWSATRPSGSWPSRPTARSRRGRSRGRGRAATRPTADRGGGGRAGRVGEGPRRARHDCRSRAQRSRARLPHGQRRGRRRSRAWSRCQRCSTWSARCAARLRAGRRAGGAARGDVPGRLDHRRAQAARDADHRRAGARGARALHGRDGLAGRRRRSRTWRSRSAPRSCAAAGCRCRWAAASSPTRRPRASWPRPRSRRGLSRPSAARAAQLWK